jgi:hypothetical protein
MLYKPDFDLAYQRIQAFWAGDCIGRCGLQVQARRENCRSAAIQPPDLQTRWTDPEYVLGQAESRMQSHYYLAEAMPVYIPGFVTADTAAYLSDQIDMREESVWYPAIIDDLDTYQVRLDPDNPWWQMTLNMTKIAAERGRGRYLVGLPDFQPGIDTISLLRSPAKLCVDLIENPDAVKRATRAVIDEVYASCYRQIRSIIAEHSVYSADWMSLVFQGKSDIIQCDFAALISPVHFAEFCLDDIKHQCRMLDNAIFHLDGPDAVRHLDLLLDVQEINAIQWVPGFGKPAAADWLPMLKRIQQAGKSLYINSPAKDVAAILQELSPKGLMIHVDDVFNTRAEGEAFIDSMLIQGL